LLEIINFNNKKYIIKDIIKEELINTDNIEIIKLTRMSNLILKKDGLMYFVEEIIDIDFEDIINKI